MPHLFQISSKYLNEYKAVLKDLEWELTLHFPALSENYSGPDVKRFRILFSNSLTRSTFKGTAINSELLRVDCLY